MKGLFKYSCTLYIKEIDGAIFSLALPSILALELSIFLYDLCY